MSKFVIYEYIYRDCNKCTVGAHKRINITCICKTTYEVTITLQHIACDIQMHRYTSMHVICYTCTNAQIRTIQMYLHCLTKHVSSSLIIRCSLYSVSMSMDLTHRRVQVMYTISPVSDSQAFSSFIYCVCNTIVIV